MTFHKTHFYDIKKKNISPNTTFQITEKLRQHFLFMIGQNRQKSLATVLYTTLISVLAQITN